MAYFNAGTTGTSKPKFGDLTMDHRVTVTNAVVQNDTFKKGLDALGITKPLINFSNKPVLPETATKEFNA